MTQEEKQLLLRVLCAGLPCGVKGRVYAETTNGEYDMNGDMIFFNSPFDVILDGINSSTEELHVVAIGNEDTVDFIEDQQTCGDPYTIEEFKPYLRPMSSMTEEEAMEVARIRGLKDILSVSLKENYIFVELDDGVFGSELYTIWFNEMVTSIEMLDWLNSHHFDYRGLIEKGLALEAPEKWNIREYMN